MIWPVTTRRAVWDVALMPPKPTVRNTATVKYSASVRFSGLAKLLLECLAIS